MQLYKTDKEVNLDDVLAATIEAAQGREVESYSGPSGGLSGEKTTDIAHTFEHHGIVAKPDEILGDIQRAFPHECRKLQLADPGTGEPTPHWGLKYDAKWMPVAVKEGYEPHTNLDVVMLVGAAQKAFGDDVKLSATFANGHFVSVRPTDKYRRSVWGDKDTVFPRLIIEAGYGGKSFRATLGWYRDVCRNLTWLHSCGAVSVAIRHSASLQDNLADAVEKFSICAESWDKTVSYLKQAEEMQVNMADMLAKIYGIPNEGDSKKKQTAHYNRTAAILKRIQTERNSLGKPPVDPESMMVSGWEAYNAIQGYAQHDQSRHGAPSGLDRVIKAAKTPEVIRAEELVFAEISA